MNKTSDFFEHSELVSAYLDGEVTEEERALVEKTPELLVEVENLKKIQEITSSTLPLDPILQEKHLAKALSSLPKEGKIIPFRQKKLIQRGGLLAVAAAAVAFILVPVINSQSNGSTEESDLATGFVESSTSANKSTQNDNTDELDESSMIPEADEDAGTVTEVPQNTQAAESRYSEADTASMEESFTTEDQEAEVLEEEEIEPVEEAGELAAEQLTTTEASSSRVFEEEAGTIDSLLEITNNLSETNSSILSSPLAPNQIESFFSENTEFETCWINEPFFDTSTRTPLFLQRIMLNGRPSLVLISEDLQSELDPLISVYQVDSSCSLFFEAPIFGETLSE